mgnify:CR=1 FL=1
MSTQKQTAPEPKPGLFFNKYQLVVNWQSISQLHILTHRVSENDHALEVFDHTRG